MEPTESTEVVNFASPEFTGSALIGVSSSIKVILPEDFSVPCDVTVAVNVII